MTTTTKNTKKNTKKETPEIVRKLEAKKLLGHIVMWNSGYGVRHTLSSVVSALKEEGLSEEVVKELAPRFAFSRAVKELEKERLIENVAIDGHVMQFQLTQREKVSGEDGEIDRKSVV